MTVTGTDDATARAVADRYFAGVSTEDLADAGIDPADTVRAHVDLAHVRPPGTARVAVRALDVRPGPGGPAEDATRVEVLVVTDDMPFLVDSVIAELSHDGSVARLLHPVVAVRRDTAGTLVEVLPDLDVRLAGSGRYSDVVAESWMSLEVADRTAGRSPDELRARLVDVLDDVRDVVEDGEAMVRAADALADALEAGAPPVAPWRTQEAVDLLRWLTAGNLTFLAHQRREPATHGPGLRDVEGSGLGVLRRASDLARALTSGPDAAATTTAPDGGRGLLVLTRASARSTVHQPVHPLYVGVLHYDADGRVVGEDRFLGVLTVAARSADVRTVPVVSRRVHDVVERTDLPENSWSGQRLLEVLQTYPRSELLCTDRASLQETATGVLDLAERRRVRLFLRRDGYGRYFSAMIYLPRDRYTTATRLRMQDVLLDRLGGTDLEHTARVTEDQLALLHVTVHTGDAVPVEPDVAALSTELVDAARTWTDRLRAAAGPRERGALGDPFGQAYQEDFPPERGLADLRVLDTLGGPDDVEVRLYTPTATDAGERRLKLYLVDQRITLSSVLPVLQSLGVEVVDERPYEVRRADGTVGRINDFGLRMGGSLPAGSDDDLTVRFAEAFGAIWSGRVGADAFNALVLRAGLTWRQASVLRALARYQRQTGSPYGQSYLTDVVGAHSDVAVALVALFETRFDPALDAATRAERSAELDRDVEAAIDAVAGLDADRILRAMLALVRATLRTNYFRRDAQGREREVLALKLDPALVPGLPAPRPAIETFVHSNRVEGVHLRFGPIARGGLRWSDRLQDYRTEVLGLVKAQTVKNAVIVPVGAKGGFVVKRPPATTGDPAADRDAQRGEGVACYRLFVAGLLDLVDDREGHGAQSAVSTPADVVRYDGDDPYLVVAADKGTASFSDIANEVAADYGFWLGDAFASGGSVGYDHKAMAITARGAWESVRRHLRELGRDVEHDEVTVVGIGDMSGDVFGNGMLLSGHLRIVAAFDHRHVFLDPDPDPATSSAERRRLFDLPRSSWADYDTARISTGGGVFARTDKSVAVGPEAAAALDIEPGDLDPTALVRAILRARVDLLWNGGIGTYVKAADETHADVGDKANDAVRVDGGELRAAVVGEGGNLGLTQRGRIEFARAGGKVNTDAVDNSAGVDCSDHEVNIKILLDSLVERGELAPHERDEQIAATTDDVAELVLRDNVAQNELLGVSRTHAAEMIGVHADLVADLEARGTVDRDLDVLPDADGFATRAAAGEGLSSPELSQLMAHVKLDLTTALADTELPDAEAFARRLPDYFPPALAERYGAAIAAHPLRRQIVTTMVANEVVDSGGLTFVHRLAAEVSAGPGDAARAHRVATTVFALDRLRADIDAADLPTRVADRLVLGVRRLLDRAARWFLTHRPQPLAVGAEIARFARPVGVLLDRVPDLLRDAEAEALAGRIEGAVELGAPLELARRVVGGLYGFGLLDVVEAAEIAEVDEAGSDLSGVGAVAELYYALSAHLGLDHLLTAVAALPRADRWDALARSSLRDELYSSLRAITLDVLAETDTDEDAAEKIEHWEQANASRLGRARAALTEIAASGRGDLATVTVAARRIRSMVR